MSVPSASIWPIRRSFSASEPSHQTTLSGRVVWETSSTHASTEDGIVKSSSHSAGPGAHTIIEQARRRGRRTCLSPCTRGLGLRAEDTLRRRGGLGAKPQEERGRVGGKTMGVREGEHDKKA